MNCTALRKAAFYLCPLLITPFVQAAGFDCAKATVKIEKLICEDAELSKLDDTLNALYRAALEDVRQTESLKTEQRAWIRKRNLCANVPCLKKTYLARMQVIRSEMDDMALLDATAAGDRAKVEELLRRGANVNVRMPGVAEWGDERTPLHLAVEQRNKQIVELLIFHGADLNARKHLGDTALHVAVEGKENGEIVELLLSRGANVNALGYLELTPLHLVATKEMAAILIAHGADVNANLGGGATPLHHAAMRGNVEIMRMLISKGANIHNRQKSGMTVLGRAVYGGHKAAVELLIAKGVDVNSKDENLLTPLHWAAMGGRKDIVELLVANGADIFATTYGERDTPLQLAKKNKNDDAAQFLSTKATEVSIAANARQAEIRKSLFDAIHKGDVAVVRNLLASGVAINLTSLYGSTPLHAAAESGNIAMVSMLLMHGADINAIDNRGETPLHRVTILGKIHLIKTLLANKANIDAKSDDGDTPLHDALSFNKLEIAGLLIENGADVNVQEINGKTPLHSAVFRGGRDMVERLLDRNADVNKKDIKESTPLHEAVSGLRKDVAELLLVKGADIDAVSERGTPLHVLEYSFSDSDMKQERLALVEFLIAKGADLNVKDREGVTVLQRALDHSHKDLVKILKAHGAK